MNNTTAPGPNGLTRIISVYLLVVVACLPFWGLLPVWFVEANFVLVVVVVTLATACLFSSGGALRIGFVPLAAAFWVVFETFRGPELDRSVELATVWGVTVLVGGLSCWVAGRDKNFLLRVILCLWATATLLAVANQLYTPTVADFEKEMSGRLMDERMRQMILFSALQNRYQFPFGNPNHLGLFFSLSLLSIPVLVHHWRARGDSAVVLLGIVATAVIQFGVLWATRSRVALLALGIGILVWVLGLGKVSRRGLLALLVCGVAVAAVGVSTPAGREMVGRIETVKARVTYWDVAVRMIRSQPILGLGVGGYGEHCSRYRGPTPHQSLYPHNVFLESMTDLGAVGTVFLLALLFGCAKRFWNPSLSKARGVNEASDVGLYNSCYPTAALSAFLAAMLVDFPQDMLYLAGIAGVIAGLERGYTKGGIRGGAKPCVQVPRRIAVLLLVVLALPALLQLFGTAMFERGRILWEERGDPNKTQQYLERATKVWPPLADAHSYRGHIFQLEGDDTAAEQSFLNATHWSSASAVHRKDLARLLWSKGRKDEALSMIKEAIRLHPIYWEYHNVLGQWLYYLGRVEEAKKEKEQAEALRVYEPDFEGAVRSAGRS